MVLPRGYWHGILQRRLRRRAALRGAASIALGSAALALLGCRDDGKSASAKLTDKSGLLKAPEDSTARAQPGGILPSYFPADVSGFDGMTSASGLTTLHNEYAYARLVNFHVFNAATGEKLDRTLDPYAAEAWEVSADGTQYTFTMQSNGGLDPRPPTNGRVLDADDVVFAWNRFKTHHRARGLLSHEANPNAPILSVTASDKKTVTMKLAYPSVSILAALAFSFYFMIQPKEAGGGFDPLQTMRGSGPWMLTDYQPSVSFTYRRNPHFYRKNQPLMDGIDGPIISEYAQGRAQLLAGNIYSFPVQQEEIVETKLSAPSLDMMLQDGFTQAASSIIFFSFKPGSIFRDDRVRQAMSMLFDRDLYIDTVFNAPRFESQGLPVDRRWASVLPVGEDEFWLDPRGSEFGPNSKYFKYDPIEARKLVLAAAGQTPIKQNFTYIAGNEYGLDYRRDAEIFLGMWQGHGDFELRPNVVDYNSVFLPKYSINSSNRTFDGDGVAFAGVAPFPEPDVLLGEWYMPGGTYYKFEPDYPTDTTWESLLKAQRSELGAEKRASLLTEVQRHHAGKMYTIHRPGFTLGYALKQPWLANAGAFISRSSNTFAGNANASTGGLHWWLDKSKS
jgi:ABC-type transport system substrate-binding protein